VDSPPGDAGARKFLLPALVAGVSLITAAGFWRVQGPTGLAGALAGLALGGGIAGLGHLLRLRARETRGQAMVRAVLLATLSSFALFIALTVAVVVFWKEAATPVLLSALGLYLTVLFYGAAAGKG